MVALINIYWFPTNFIFIPVKDGVSVCLDVLQVSPVIVDSPERNPIALGARVTGPCNNDENM